MTMPTTDIPAKETAVITPTEKDKEKTTAQSLHSTMNANLGTNNWISETRSRLCKRALHRKRQGAGSGAYSLLATDSTNDAICDN